MIPVDVVKRLMAAATRLNNRYNIEQVEVISLGSKGENHCVCSSGKACIYKGYNNQTDEISASSADVEEDEPDPAEERTQLESKSSRCYRKKKR